MHTLSNLRTWSGIYPHDCFTTRNQQGYCWPRANASLNDSLAKCQKKQADSRRQTTLVIRAASSTAASVKTSGSHLREWISVFISRATIIQFLTVQGFVQLLDVSVLKWEFSNKEGKLYWLQNQESGKKKWSFGTICRDLYGLETYPPTHTPSFTHGIIITDLTEAGIFGGQLSWMLVLQFVFLSWFWRIAGGKCKCIIFIDLCCRKVRSHEVFRWAGYLGNTKTYNKHRPGSCN